MNKVYIIAEAGVNHNGKIELAIKLCDEAKKAGVDAVKFQTFITEKNITKNVEMAEYQKLNTGKTKSQFEMAKELELSFGDFSKIKKYCDEIGIDFLSTPDEEDSLDFLVSLGIKLIKVGSGEINNIHFLRKIGNKHGDVILSTGMSTLGEVEKAYFTLLEAGAKSVALLHCTTNYPCPIKEVNLNAMLTLKESFKVRIGYSDHTLGIEVPIAAVAIGAEIIEKHFTLDKNLEGPDHLASLEPGELKKMVDKIRNIEIAMGDGLKKPNKSELEILKIVRKSIVASKKIKKGEMFSEENIAVKRAKNGLSSANWDMVIGRIASKEFQEDEVIVI